MKRKIRNKVKLHPVMSVLIIIFGVIILSLLLSIFNFSFSYTTINSSRGEYISTTESIINMFSLHGLKYIFANTVANFANYKVLSNLPIYRNSSFFVSSWRPLNQAASILFNAGAVSYVQLYEHNDKLYQSAENKKYWNIV